LKTPLKLVPRESPKEPESNLLKIFGLGIILLGLALPIYNSTRGKLTELMAKRRDLIGEKAEIADEMRQIIPELEAMTKLLKSENGKSPPIEPVETNQGTKAYDPEDPVYVKVREYILSQHSEFNLLNPIDKTRLRIKVEGFLERLGVEITPCSQLTWRMVGRDNNQIHEGGISSVQEPMFNHREFAEEHWLQGQTFQVHLGGTRTFFVTPASVWSFEMQNKTSYISTCVGSCPNEISDPSKRYLGPMDATDFNVNPAEISQDIQRFLNWLSGGDLKRSVDGSEVPACNDKDFFPNVSEERVGDTGYPIRPER